MASPFLPDCTAPLAAAVAYMRYARHLPVARLAWQVWELNGRE